MEKAFDLQRNYHGNFKPSQVASSLCSRLSPSRRKFLGAVSGALASFACGTNQAAVEDRKSPQVPRIREPNNEPPRLRIYHSKWSLTGLPRDGKEWSLEEKLIRVKEAGFDGIDVEDILENEVETVGLIRKYGLELSMGGSNVLRKLEEIRRGLEICKRTGARCYVAVCGSAFMSDEEATAFVKQAIRMSAEAEIPLLFETHRHSLTESAYRVLKLIERVPEMRFCADLSHYVLSGELAGHSPQEWFEFWGPILDRCLSFQCRISNGEQIQVDVADGTSEMAQKWVELWAEILRRWLKSAQPGEIFPVVSELGPPGYSMTDLSGREISDRWQQSLVMKRLVEQAWKKARSV